MKTIEVTLYQFDELDDMAKQRAISDARESIGCCDATFIDDDYNETLKMMEEVFGIDVRDLESRGHSRFRLQGGWAELEDDSVFLIRYVDRLADRVYKGKYYSTPMHRDEEGRYHYKSYHSKVLSGDYSCCLTGTYTDWAVEKAICKRYEYVRRGYTIREFIDSILDEFCKDWQRDSDYCYTDENIIERLTEDEGCMFFKSGRQYPTLV